MVILVAAAVSNFACFSCWPKCFALARFKATFAFLRRQRKQYTQNSKLQVTEQKRFLCQTSCFLSSCNLRECKANFSLKCFASPTQTFHLTFCYGYVFLSKGWPLTIHNFRLKDSANQKDRFSLFLQPKVQVDLFLSKKLYLNLFIGLTLYKANRWNTCYLCLCYFCLCYLLLLTKGSAILKIAPPETSLTVRVHNRTMLHADETKPRRANNNDHNAPQKTF